jgi:hypothetical protein
MVVENIRGTASISQNEENVNSFFEKIFGYAEAQTNPFVNPHSEKTFRPTNAQTEENVKDFFEFVGELNDVNDCFGELVDKSCEAYFNDFVNPVLNKNLSLTKKQMDVLIKRYNELFDTTFFQPCSMYVYSVSATYLVCMPRTVSQHRSISQALPA